MSMDKPRSYSMQPDGKLVVDVNRLLASERVKRDLQVLRKRINAGANRASSLPSAAAASDNIESR